MSNLNNMPNRLNEDVEEARNYFLACLESGVPAKSDDDRWKRLWAMPWEGWTKPTRAELMALGTLIGPGAVVAGVLDITGRDWRYLASGERPVSWVRWHVLLEAAGFGSILRLPPLWGVES